MHLELLDTILLIILGFGLVRGIMDGFLRQLAGLLGFIVGFILAKMLYQQLAVHVTPLFGDGHDTLADVISFILIWLVVPLGFSLIASGLSKIMDASSLGFINRFLGAALGVTKWVLILTLVLNVYAWADPKNEIISKSRKEASYLYKPILKVGAHYIPNALHQVDKVKEELEKRKLDIYQFSI